jgi:hypothetical protein
MTGPCRWWPRLLFGLHFQNDSREDGRLVGDQKFPEWRHRPEDNSADLAVNSQA